MEMTKFEKIKTIADKRHALDKRGKLVANDFQSGDVLILTEKMDGHNTSFTSDGIAYSRETRIEPQYNAPLIPFASLVKTFMSVMPTVIESQLNPEHEYQFYGEFMVRNRVIQYKENVYESWVMFDVYDATESKYLGIQKAIEVANEMILLLGDNASKLLTPKVLNDNYIFTTYKELENQVHLLCPQSETSATGKMEGIVITNTTRSFQNKPLRSKVVNTEFKESQRSVTNNKNHSVEIRNLLQHLTQPRVTKIILNLRDLGLVNPKSAAYYTIQLELVVRAIAKDINDETDFAIDYTTIQAGEKVYNKIEGVARLTMVDIKNNMH